MTTDNSPYLISYDVPIPSRKGATSSALAARGRALAALQPGGSFFLPDRGYATAYDLYRGYQFQHPNTKFTARKEGTGVRIWRIA